MTALFSLASILIAQHKQPEAILRLEAASKLSPGLLVLQLALADLYMKTGRLDDADAMVQRLLAASPKLAPAVMIQGMVAMSRVNLEAAEAAFRKATELEPKSRGRGTCWAGLTSS